MAGPSGLYSQPAGDAPVVPNPTPYSAALVCEAEYARVHSLAAPRVAIGRIADYTGKSESDNSGRKITQGAALMAMSALSKAGVQLVERFDTSVAEMELKYANNRLIGADQQGGPDYRQIMAGSIRRTMSATCSTCSRETSRWVQARITWASITLTMMPCDRR